MSGRATFLLMSDFERLEEWCRLVRVVFSQVPVLVGSAITAADHRDVDIRVVLPDAKFDRDWKRREKVRYMNRAISIWGQRETGLAIDFQIQRATEAQAFDGPRRPMGNRDWALIPTSGTPR
jgi:hypothetical protein